MVQSRIQPGPGQESVWDYPRPPRLERCDKSIKIVVAETVVAEATECYRVLETSHPPVYYLAPADVRQEWLRPGIGSSWCEWKGRAVYYDVQIGDLRIPQAAWSYPQPTDAFAPIAGFLAFYPSKMDQCLVDGEAATAQAGDFYGGWITADIVGPFKGPPGTRFW